MKKERQFYRSLLIGLFITVLIISFISSQRLIYMDGILCAASAVIYPLAYFIFIIYTERYGKTDSLQLLNISAISLINCGSDKTEGLRACVSQTKSSQFKDLEYRLKQFNKHYS
jgi:hypothetical protein